eukprot:gene9694-47566_t
MPVAPAPPPRRRRPRGARQDCPLCGAACEWDWVTRRGDAPSPLSRPAGGLYCELEMKGQ